MMLILTLFHQEHRAKWDQIRLAVVTRKGLVENVYNDYYLKYYAKKNIFICNAKFFGCFAVV